MLNPKRRDPPGLSLLVFSVCSIVPAVKTHEAKACNRSDFSASVTRSYYYHKLFCLPSISLSFGPKSLSPSREGVERRAKQLTLLHPSCLSILLTTSAAVIDTTDFVIRLASCRKHDTSGDCRRQHAAGEYFLGLSATGPVHLGRQLVL